MQSNESKVPKKQQTDPLRKGLQIEIETTAIPEVRERSQ